MNQNPAAELGAAPRAPGWGDLLRGANLLRSLALSGGVALHAVNLYLSTTILPSVVWDIGGLDYYAWNTTVYVVASIVGAAISARLLTRCGPRLAYALAALVFAVGALLCAVAPSMPVMLVGRGVQGLGGGMLVALPYAMTRIVFPEPLWPRAMAMISGMWGIATLLGPALGGIFAELGIWRTAFWSLIPIIAVFTLMAALVLPRRDAAPATASPLPARQLALLTVAVLAASTASVSGHIGWSIATLLLAGVLVLTLVRTEAHAPQRLLPRGSFQVATPLGALYAMTALLAVTVTCTEIFTPLFLQVLHGHSPLWAGYIAALMSVGWTLGSLISSGLQGGRLIATLRGAPMLSLLSLVMLAVLMPWPGEGGWGLLTLTCLALIAGGMGVGLAFPHLAARVLHAAPDDEQDLAASSIMTVQLCATAFGAALAGLTVNLAGLPAAGGEMDVANAARWLFIVLLLAPALCLRLMWSRAGDLGA